MVERGGRRFIMATSRRKKISRLGTLAILIGGGAWAATRLPPLGVGPVVIGTVGLVLGLLAMLGALLIGNTGKFVPLLGLLVCWSAIAFGIVHNNTGVGVADQFRAVIARFRPASASGLAPAQSGHAAPVKAAPPAADDPVGKGTIFDMSAVNQDSAKSATPATPASVSPPGQTPAVVPAIVLPAPPTLNATQRYTAAMTAVTMAHTRVDAATAALLPALSKAPAYQAAKSELDDASAALAAARANNSDPGNAEFVAAGQRYLNAKAAVQKLINAAAAADPASIEARGALVTAQGELRVAKEDLVNAGGAGRK
jgi:hypothetical protein